MSRAFKLEVQGELVTLPYGRERYATKREALDALGEELDALGALDDGELVAVKVSRREAEEAIGRFSRTGKMPGASWSLSAFECGVGGVLSKVPGSVCAKCYAQRGAYAWGSTKKAMARRKATIPTHAFQSDDPAWCAWVDSFADALEGEAHFRWFDSGDLPGVDFAMAVCEVAELTPGTAHWLPTKERGTVSELLKRRGAIPANLCIRVSAYMRGESHALGHLEAHGIVASTVSAPSPDSFECEADKRDGQCGPCRACWKSSIRTVNYPGRWGADKV
jgi:hypothetical protein